MADLIASLEAWEQILRLNKLEHMNLEVLADILRDTRSQLAERDEALRRVRELVDVFENGGSVTFLSGPPENCPTCVRGFVDAVAVALAPAHNGKD